MMRTCDGTDPNLTRLIPSPDFKPDEGMRISPWHRAFAKPGEVCINCQCGLTFDDVNRVVYYPHPEF